MYKKITLSSILNIFKTKSISKAYHQLYTDSRGYTNYLYTTDDDLSILFSKYLKGS